MDILQTIGICVGALALVAIIVMLLFVFIRFAPRSAPKDTDPLRYLRGKSREEIHQILTTPIYDLDEKPRQRSKKKGPPPRNGGSRD